MFRRVVPRRVPDPERRAAVLIHGMNYAPEMIGVGKYTTELATFLAGRGHAVEVVAALRIIPLGGWHRPNHGGARPGRRAASG